MEPRTKNQDAQDSLILDLGSWILGLAAFKSAFKLNAAQPLEPRTKNQDAQDSLILVLGSWILGLAAFKPACKNLS